jgi:hypothetical protein
MVRVRYERRVTDYVHEFRPTPWFGNWIERPRLLASALAISLGNPKTICDPACGDGSAVLNAHFLSPISSAIFADISPNVLQTIMPQVLPFEATITVGDVFDTLTALDHVDCIVLTEILEHLADPDALLRLARTKTDWLVASSPIVPEGIEDHTDQHLWSFDMAGYREMLEEAGWNPTVWLTANCIDHPYASGFQVWGCGT